MPYITCPDGQTYSRYNQSEYVKWCICNEKRVNIEKHEACMKDPSCKESRDNSNKIIIGSSLIIIVGIIVVAIGISRLKK